MQNLLQRLFILISLLVFGVVVGITALIGVQLQQNLSSEDASAIIDGRLESGYESAAYLLSRSPLGRIQECGSVLIPGNKAITAAHCLESDSSVFVGFDRSGNTANLITTAITIHPAWNSARVADNDLAVISLGNDRQSTTADIGSPRIGCDYVVVGYGQDRQGINGLRKSADICIDTITANTMEVRGVDGTACFGDSGSPIFRRDTNEVVGIVSQILTDPQNPCSRSDTIRAVRIDSNLAKIAAPEIAFDVNSADQPIEIDLRQGNVTYLGGNQFEVSINASITNNTRDTIDTLSVDWCLNEAPFLNRVESVEVTSTKLALRDGYFTDANCQLLADGNQLQRFETKQFQIDMNLHWELNEDMPVDMLVSGTLGDQFKVFALSNNGDLPQVIPNSSTLLVSLDKPIINDDNLQLVITASLSFLIITLSFISIKSLFRR